MSIDMLVESVLASPKYRDISPQLVRNIGTQELSKRRTLKEALKATKNKLHQMGGAYLEGADYARWLHDLRACADDKNELQRVCRSIMTHHASTRERLPILDQFYTTLLTDLAPISSLLDLACGFQPLALPWMPLAEPVTYYAYDIYQHMMDFLQEWFALIGIQGHAQMCDILQACPTHAVDVAFVLKTIPCLEQLDKHAGQRLLQAINARYLIVSFPVHSLGGKKKGMVAHYEAQFRALLGDAPWTVKRVEFATELVFVVTKQP
jgi:16S rRNA (guanine(1405)-N(7))-methyltransferase